MKTSALALMSGVAAGVVALAGCSGGTDAVSQARPTPTGSPYQAAPSPAPTASLADNGACFAKTPMAQGQQPVPNNLVTVDAHPEGVIAFWIPGLNQRPCRVESGTFSASVAERLAEDINKSALFPRGAVNCPNDDGSAVELYFEYGSAHPSEYAHVGLAGCTSIEAPGRTSRVASADLLSALRDIAPSP